MDAKKRPSGGLDSEPAKRAKTRRSSSLKLDDITKLEKKLLKCIDVNGALLNTDTVDEFVSWMRYATEPEDQSLCLAVLQQTSNRMILKKFCSDGERESGVFVLKAWTKACLKQEGVSIAQRQLLRMVLEQLCRLPMTSDVIAATKLGVQMKKVSKFEFTMFEDPAFGNEASKIKVLANKAIKMWMAAYQADLKREREMKKAAEDKAVAVERAKAAARKQATLAAKAKEMAFLEARRIKEMALKKQQERAVKVIEVEESAPTPDLVFAGRETQKLEAQKKAVTKERLEEHKRKLDEQNKRRKEEEQNKLRKMEQDPALEKPAPPAQLAGDTTVLRPDEPANTNNTSSMVDAPPALGDQDAGSVQSIEGDVTPLSNMPSNPDADSKETTMQGPPASTNTSQGSPSSTNTTQRPAASTNATSAGDSNTAQGQATSASDGNPPAVQQQTPTDSKTAVPKNLSEEQPTDIAGASTVESAYRKRNIKLQSKKKKKKKVSWGDSVMMKTIQTQAHSVYGGWGLKKELTIPNCLISKAIQMDDSLTPSQREAAMEKIMMQQQKAGGGGGSSHDVLDFSNTPRMRWRRPRSVAVDDVLRDNAQKRVDFVENGEEPMKQSARIRGIMETIYIKASQVPMSPRPAPDSGPFDDDSNVPVIPHVLTPEVVEQPELVPQNPVPAQPSALPPANTSNAIQLVQQLLSDPNLVQQLQQGQAGFPNPGVQAAGGMPQVAQAGGWPPMNAAHPHQMQQQQYPVQHNVQQPPFFAQQQQQPQQPMNPPNSYVPPGPGYGVRGPQDRPTHQYNAGNGASQMHPRDAPPRRESRWGGGSSQDRPPMHGGNRPPQDGRSMMVNQEARIPHHGSRFGGPRIGRGEHDGGRGGIHEGFHGGRDGGWDRWGPKRSPRNRGDRDRDFQDPGMRRFDEFQERGRDGGRGGGRGGGRNGGRGGRRY